MNRLQQFVELLTGSFDNREQYEQMQKEGNQTFPLARHVNTACNDKITGLPQDFDGVFVLEESYYNVGERTNASPHLFLFTMEGEAVKLTSYEMPEGYDKDSFTYQQLKPVAFDTLKPSAKFTQLSTTSVTASGRAAVRACSRRCSSLRCSSVFPTRGWRFPSRWR